MSITTSQRFFSWEDLQAASEDWTVHAQFEFQKWKEDNHWAYYICQHKANGCEWRLFASHNKNHEIKVKSISKHTCAGWG